MTNKELQTLLQEYPDDLKVKLRLDRPISDIIKSFDDENIVLTSETAHADDSFPEEEWDNEDGKIVLGDGEQFLLINPSIV